MKQTLHIFLKDARHLWIEILLLVTATLVLVPTYPSTWTQYSYATSYFRRAALASSVPLIAVLLLALTPIGWWLLITRVIHAERLVGDRQFWLTRPYTRTSLLTAKALFLIAFIYLPLFVMQALVLANAGFNPLLYLSGLLLGALCITCLAVLPLAALASVTSTIARATLAALGVAVYLILLLTAASGASMHLANQGLAIPTTLIACVCIAVVLVQYFTRRTKLSLILLAFLLVSISVASFLPPSQAAISRNYPPLPAQAAPVHFAYDPGKSGFIAFAMAPMNRGDINIGLPILQSGVPSSAEQIVVPQLIRASIDAPDGTHWRGLWLPLNTQQWDEEQSSFLAGFFIPRALYDHLHGTALTLHLDFAYSVAYAGTVAHVSLPQQEFLVPGFGICQPQPDPYHLDQIANIVCRAPLHEPGYTYIQTTWATDDGPCAATGTQQGVQGATWVGALEQSSFSFNLVPLWSSPLGFPNRFAVDDKQQNYARHLCPGTQITFTRYNLARRAQSALDIPSFRLPALSVGRVRLTQKVMQ